MQMYIFLCCSLRPLLSFFCLPDTIGPVAPKQSSAFISVNVTNATLHLETWIANGCPINYFNIKYKAKSDMEWTLATNNISPQQKTYEMRYLLPGTFYVLSVFAHSDAGDTHQEYVFATLTPNGGKMRKEKYSN